MLAQSAPIGSGTSRTSHRQLRVAVNLAVMPMGVDLRLALRGELRRPLAPLAHDEPASAAVLPHRPGRRTVVVWQVSPHGLFADRSRKEESAFRQEAMALVDGLSIRAGRPANDEHTQLTVRRRRRARWEAADDLADLRVVHAISESQQEGTAHLLSVPGRPERRTSLNRHFQCESSWPTGHRWSTLQRDHAWLTA
jgi:hypothetical protein